MRPIVQSGLWSKKYGTLLCDSSMEYQFFPVFQEEPVLKLTGREAVEYFAKCHHIGKIQSIYFNHAENRHFRPYDLISVHKNKVSIKNKICLNNLRRILISKLFKLFSALGNVANYTGIRI
jgi:hypothetical protein